MKKIRIMTLFLLLMTAFFFIGTCAAASERNIYVGDIIELKISSQDLTEEVLREKFSDFEIVSLAEEHGYFLIKLRTFETGEKRVVLGDKEIVVVVKSALQDIQPDGAMEGDLEPEAPSSGIPWRYIFYILLAAFAVSGVIYLKDRFHKKSKVRLTPYQRFLAQSEGISFEDNEYFVKQTSFFKEYLEAVYQCKLKGMTSSEILVTVDKLPRFQNIKQELGSWLRESDFYKFTGTAAPSDRKKEMQRKLAELAGRIETSKGAAS